MRVIGRRAKYVTHIIGKPNITGTSSCAIGNFRTWLLYKCFMSLSLIVLQTNIKFLKITVTWTNIWEKFTLITLEIHNNTYY